MYEEDGNLIGIASIKKNGGIPSRCDFNWNVMMNWLVCWLLFLFGQSHWENVEPCPGLRVFELRDQMCWGDLCVWLVCVCDLCDLCVCVCLVFLFESSSHRYYCIACMNPSFRSSEMAGNQRFCSLCWCFPTLVSPHVSLVGALQHQLYEFPLGISWEFHGNFIVPTDWLSFCSEGFFKHQTTGSPAGGPSKLPGMISGSKTGQPSLTRTSMACDQWSLYVALVVRCPQLKRYGYTG